MGNCSCGTHLVEDAAFCHRCGKAQREFLEAEPVEAQPVLQAANVPDVAAKPLTQPVSFGNGVALRVGFLAASLASILDSLPVVNVFFLLWSCVAGYGAVAMYRRRTGQKMTLTSGAKMGWITGTLNAVMLTVFFTLTFVISISDPATFHSILSSLETKNPAQYKLLAELLREPVSMALFALMIMFFIFVSSTLAGVAGGLLGARFGRARKEP